MAKKKVNEEVINHFGAVRIRATGTAVLKMTLFTLDEKFSDILFPVPLQATNDVEPNRLANLTTQRAKLRVQATEIDEAFKVSKIVIFVKPVAKSWPETA